MIKNVAKVIAPVIERDNDIYWAGEYGRPIPQESAERIARAAIEAMLDPTQPMIDAADELAGTIAPMDAYSAAIEAALAEDK